MICSDNVFFEVILILKQFFLFFPFLSKRIHPLIDTEHSWDWLKGKSNTFTTWNPKMWILLLYWNWEMFEISGPAGWAGSETLSVVEVYVVAEFTTPFLTRPFLRSKAESFWGILRYKQILLFHTQHIPPEHCHLKAKYPRPDPDWTCVIVSLDLTSAETVKWMVKVVRSKHYSALKRAQNK